MRIISKTVYNFDELTDSAKEKARQWWRQSGYDPAWCDESRESIEVFCAQFGIRLRDLSICTYRGVSYRFSEFDNGHFRGKRLRDFTRENYPTGYCLDADLSVAFFDTFKATGDAKRAFLTAVQAGFAAWLVDLEWQESDEHIDDLLTANGFEFDEKGAPA